MSEATNWGKFMQVFDTLADATVNVASAKASAKAMAESQARQRLQPEYDAQDQAPEAIVYSTTPRNTMPESDMVPQGSGALGLPAWVGYAVVGSLVLGVLVVAARS